LHFATGGASQQNENPLKINGFIDFSPFQPPWRRACVQGDKEVPRGGTNPEEGFGAMKSSNRALLAGLILAVASFSGAAQATTVLNTVYTEVSDDVSLPAPEGNAGIGPSASLPEFPSWALMMLGLGALSLTGSQQAKKRREAIASF
jgi:hypothetical protein